jgi:hypothetical protein
LDDIPKHELKPTRFAELVPDHKIYGTFKDAVCGIKESFGGKLLQIDKKVKPNGNHMWTYRCGHEGDDGCNTCPLRVFVKSHGSDDNTKRFSIWSGNQLNNGISRNSHDHTVIPFDVNDVPGVPEELRKIVDSLIVMDNLVRPNEAFLEIKEHILDRLPSDHWLRPQVLEDELWEALKQQVRNYLQYARKQRIGGYALRTIQDIVDICDLNSLKIPATYLCRDDYESAAELADALNVESVDTMLLFHLGSGSTLKKLLDFVEEENKSLSEKQKCAIREEAKSQVRAAFIACSPSLLFRLLQVGKLPPGMRVLYRDGTHGILLCGSKLVTHLISGDVRFRRTHLQVTNSCPAAFYLICPEEYKYSTVASDIWAKDICEALFSIQLEIDWCASDMALGFLTGVKAVWKNLKGILNDCFHVLQKIGPGKNSELRKKCKTEHQKEHAPRNWTLAQNSKSPAQFSCCTDLFIQDLNNGSEPETRAADYITNTYLGPLSRNWSYRVTGEFK